MKYTVEIAFDVWYAQSDEIYKWLEDKNYEFSTHPSSNLIATLPVDTVSLRTMTMLTFSFDQVSDALLFKLTFL